MFRVGRGAESFINKGPSLALLTFLFDLAICIWPKRSFIISGMLSFDVTVLFIFIHSSNLSTQEALINIIVYTGSVVGCVSLLLLCFKAIFFHFMQLTTVIA